jgi:formate dehydrogenase subunit delta
MHSETMVHNANGIAQYFAAYPREEAIAGVADHIQKYWERRMRQQILEYVAHGGGGLHELVVEAVRRLSAPTAQSR